jgi:5-methyltetrahydrofolate--homocysteine methyltransferase
MNALAERLAVNGVLVGDGAWGTQLMARGLPEGQPPEWFALERPDVIEEVARLYVEAGADLVTTDTFGGTSFRLRLHGLDAQRERVNREAVLAVKRAASGRALVSASVGPTGQLLEPFGDTSPEAVEEAFAEQITVLAGAGADVVCVETMSDLTEATRAVKAAKAVAPHLPVIATMTFERTPRGYFTVMGTSVEKTAAGLAAAGADVVGSNCGTGIEDMLEVARAMAKATALPIAIQPNAGLPVPREGRAVYEQTPEAMAAHVPELLEAGVAIVGGCCGTTPEHTRALRRCVDAWRARRPGGEPERR